MSPLVLSCVIFVVILGGIFLGALLRRTLPEQHQKKESQDLVRLGVKLVATIAALVLGLLIASAKSSPQRAVQRTDDDLKRAATHGARASGAATAVAVLRHGRVAPGCAKSRQHARRHICTRRNDR